MTHRVLAIVARYPEPGRVKTRLAATIGAEAAANLYRAFLVDLAARFSHAARQEGYTLIWAQAPGEGDLRTVVGAGAQVIGQHGDGFAERLHNVCADLAAAGAREIVIISSDSPHIPAAWVARAFGLVARGEVALGPAMDGGYYLIGVRVQSSPPNLFLGIRMSTEQVLTETLSRASALALPVSFLPATFDVDEAESLPRLAKALAVPGPEGAECPHTWAELARLDTQKGNCAALPAASAATPPS